MKQPNSTDASGEGRLLHVSRAQFLGSLAASLVVFFFAAGPLWRHAGDIGKLDGAIFWSYGAIPLLIAGCLIASRRWSLRGFLLDTMSLTLVKYVVTCTIAIALWASVSPVKGASAAARPRHPSALTEQAIVPTPVDPARTGSLRATVVDPQGRPLPGALVYVGAGLEDHVFAPPSDPLVLEHGSQGVTPALAVAQVGQRIDARSTDGHMHTLVASLGGEVLFNVPLLASGAPTTMRARDAGGMTTLRCNVHPAEHESRLLTLAHPFFGWSDAAGSVVIEGVPAGRLRIGAVHGERGAGESAVELRPLETAEVRIDMAP